MFMNQKLKLVIYLNANIVINVFIQKKIIKEIINVPINHKINLKSKDPKMILKPLLKKIFFLSKPIFFFLKYPLPKFLFFFQ